MTAEIFNDVLDHRDGHYNCEGYGRKHRASRLANVWDELQEHQEEKVGVCQLSELEEQILREEGQTSVLAGAHLV